MSVNVHIEHLVLDALPLSPGEAAQVRLAVQAELGRLFGNRQQLAPNPQAALGRQIALALYQHIRA
jgi:hypothetical protein